MTAMDTAWKVFEAAGVKDADKEDAKIEALGIQHSLKNHAGKGWSGLARPAQLNGQFSIHNEH